MPRFYCSPPLPTSSSFQLPQDAAHHASRVLRLKKNSKVAIFDGLGNERHGVISEINGKRVIISDIIEIDVNRESPLHIVLAQSLSSSEKMDWVIQKTTELGVTEIQPLSTERSIAKLTLERTAKRIEHWQQVAISACEQCGRNVLPQIHAPLDIMQWMQQMRESPITKLILLPEGTASLPSQIRPQNKVALLIGAEGGFSQAESIASLKCGFTAIRMGARVLRTETAAVAGLAALQTLWGDFQ